MEDNSSRILLQNQRCIWKWKRPHEFPRLSSGHRRIDPKPSSVHRRETLPTKGTSVNQGNPNVLLTSGTSQPTFASCKLVPLSQSDFARPWTKNQTAGVWGLSPHSSDHLSHRFLFFEPIFDPVTLANLIFLLSGGSSDSFYYIYLS